jgi:hypothetical protein
MQIKDVKSTLTTNQDIIQLATVMWSNADYLNRTVTSSNVLAKYRSKLLRMAIKMQREAMQLGECLDPPNKDAFISLTVTKAFSLQNG